MRWLAILLAALVGLAVPEAFSAQSASVSAVVVDVDAAYPPFMSGSVSNARGLYPSIIETVFGMMGTPVYITAKPWKRCMNELDQGTAAVGGLYITRDRLKKYDFSDPLFTENIFVYFNKRKPVVFHSLHDLYGLNVGVRAGWSYGNDFDLARQQNRFAVFEANSDLQNFGKLAAGRLDVVLASPEAVHAQIQDVTLSQIEAASTPLARNAGYLAFNKKSGAAVMLRDFNQMLDELKQSLRYRKIISETLGAEVEDGKPE
jgi:polar amino acid transport system substrate-binding protein